MLKFAPLDCGGLREALTRLSVKRSVSPSTAREGAKRFGEGESEGKGWVAGFSLHFCSIFAPLDCGGFFLFFVFIVKTYGF